MNTWIRTSPAAPYFVTETGEPWTPIGHNSAITWPDLGGLFRRVNSAAVARHLDLLLDHGVTCLRLMLEYCRSDHRYLEQPVGRFKPHMVQYWDDLIAMCEKRGLRLLLTPFDTFWMWNRWHAHPYNARNGGPCADRACLLLCRRTRDAIKNRLAFATERWGSSGVIFAWDLWNEIHPSYANNSAESFPEFVDDVGGFLRSHELRIHGRAHLQTVSVFSPQLDRDPRIAETVFRHPALDFANTHFYEEGTIDDPRDTVAAALAAAALTRNAISEATERRPFFDSEHGPIHTYKDHHRSLPEAFDDEYFRHMQWAHFACGGAGGSMRWPNRKPHVLTRGMHRAQLALSKFLPLIDWPSFRRRPLCFEDPHIFGCADASQAIIWAVRSDSIDSNGMLDPHAPEREMVIPIPNLSPGNYQVTTWNTQEGEPAAEFEIEHDEPLRLKVHTDLAAAIRRMPAE